MKRMALLSVFAASTASAFSVNRTDSNHLIKWYDTDLVLDLQIDANGPTRLSSGYTQEDVRDAIDRSIASWNDVACSAIELRVSGTTTATGNVVSDGVEAVDTINRLVWIENDADYPYGSKVLGVTSPVFYQDGTIIEADVILNGVDQRWAVYTDLEDVPNGSTEGQATDVESVVVHELGHLIGLGHVLDGAEMSEPPTMTPTVDPTLRTRSLEEHDENGACFLYPEDGSTTHACSANAECPEFISLIGEAEEIVDTSRCSSGVCTKIEDVDCGDGDAGDRCCTDNCKSSLICQEIAAGMKYCAERCESTDSDSDDCADGFICALYDGRSDGVCISEAVTGCDCDTNDNCTSSCACDTDCGGTTTSDDGDDDDGGCDAAGTDVWSLLAMLGVLRYGRRYTMFA